MVKRTVSVTRLGLFFRSRYKARCFRRNRFSAAIAHRERSSVPNTISTSNKTRIEVWKNFTSWGRFSMADKYYKLKRANFLVRSNIFGAQWGCSYGRRVRLGEIDTPSKSFQLVASTVRRGDRLVSDGADASLETNSSVDGPRRAFNFGPILVSLLTSEFVRSLMGKAIAIAVLLLVMSDSLQAGPLTELERQRLIAHLEMTERWLIGEVSQLSPAQHAFRPSPDAWSIMQVVDHLVVVGPIYWQDLQKAMQGPPSTVIKSGSDADILWYGIDRTNRETAIPSEVPKGELRDLRQGLDAIRKHAQLRQYMRTTCDAGANLL